MSVKTLVIAAALLLIPSTVLGMEAQPQCAPRDMVIEGLQTKHAEVIRSRGLAANGQMVEILTSESGSFSILLTTTGGISCLMAWGDAWGNIDKAPPFLPKKLKKKL
mgnify:FL=1|jgi:hypothetical protein|tara:strand:- start:23915 stop:24235 length:321 start_codon:yes stop_codon:yes gene_type:complete